MSNHRWIRYFIANSPPSLHGTDAAPGGTDQVLGMVDQTTINLEAIHPSLGGH